jgi:hypothetical protein
MDRASRPPSTLPGQRSAAASPMHEKLDPGFAWVTMIHRRLQARSSANATLYRIGARITHDASRRVCR